MLGGITTSTAPLRGDGYPVTRLQGTPVTYHTAGAPIRGDGLPLGGEIDLHIDTGISAPPREPTLEEAVAICREELMSRHEAADFAMTGTQTLQYWVKNGLPTTRFGQHAYISRDDLREWLAAQGRKPRGE